MTRFGWKIKFQFDLTWIGYGVATGDSCGISLDPETHNNYPMGISFGHFDGFAYESFGYNADMMYFGFMDPDDAIVGIGARNPWTGDTEELACPRDINISGRISGGGTMMRKDAGWMNWD